MSMNKNAFIVRWMLWFLLLIVAIIAVVTVCISDDNQYKANIITELIGIVFTLLVVDNYVKWLQKNEWRKVDAHVDKRIIIILNKMITAYRSLLKLPIDWSAQIAVCQNPSGWREAAYSDIDRIQKICDVDHLKTLQNREWMAFREGAEEFHRLAVEVLSIFNDRIEPHKYIYILSIDEAMQNSLKRVETLGDYLGKQPHEVTKLQYEGLLQVMEYTVKDAMSNFAHGKLLYSLLNEEAYRESIEMCLGSGQKRTPYARIKAGKLSRTIPWVALVAIVCATLVISVRIGCKSNDSAAPENPINVVVPPTTAQADAVEPDTSNREIAGDTRDYHIRVLKQLLAVQEFTDDFKGQDGVDTAVAISRDPSDSDKFNIIFDYISCQSYGSENDTYAEYAKHHQFVRLATVLKGHFINSRQISYCPIYNLYTCVVSGGIHRYLTITDSYGSMLSNVEMNISIEDNYNYTESFGVLEGKETDCIIVISGATNARFCGNQVSVYRIIDGYWRKIWPYPDFPPGTQIAIDRRNGQILHTYALNPVRSRNSMSDVQYNREHIGDYVWNRNTYTYDKVGISATGTGLYNRQDYR